MIIRIRGIQITRCRTAESITFFSGGPKEFCPNLNQYRYYLTGPIIPAFGHRTILGFCRSLAARKVPLELLPPFISGLPVVFFNPGNSVALRIRMRPRKISDDSGRRPHGL